MALIRQCDLCGDTHDVSKIYYKISFTECLDTKSISGLGTNGNYNEYRTVKYDICQGCYEKITEPFKVLREE